MADAKARRAAIQKATAQVKAGGVFIRRASATGPHRTTKAVRVASKTKR